MAKGGVVKFAPHKALNQIGWGKLTVDERVILHRVVRRRDGTVTAVSPPPPPSLIHTPVGLLEPTRRVESLTANRNSGTAARTGSHGGRRRAWPRGGAPLK